MTGKQSGPGPRKRHAPRRVQPKNHDTYKARAKSANAIVCDTCGVVCHEGRWYWGAPPLCDVRAGLCPACERIRDRYPAGTIRLDPAYSEHEAEIRSMISNTEEAERQEHPLERLMDVSSTESGITLTTTGIHLARRIANKLERRFHKQARIRYPEEEQRIEVVLPG